MEHDGTDVTNRKDQAAQNDSGLRINEVSERLGIPAPTLRSWERRYGLPSTPRSPGGHRRYDTASLAELRLMRDEIARGSGASSAARAVATMLDMNNPALERIDSILLALQSSDAQGVAEILEQTRTELGLATTLDHVLMPAMRRVGDWWETGRCNVAQEHLATQAARRWLARVTALMPTAPGERPVLLACGPRDLHTVGLDALSALLIERGCSSRVLGTPTPEHKLLAAIRTTSASAVVIVSHLATQRRSAVDALSSAADTGAAVFYAGNAFALPGNRLAVPGTYLGESLSMAAAMIVHSVAADTPKSPALDQTAPNPRA